ncbi:MULTISPECIES: hypothetical protein [unclassified Streptomyces]|uniref:hypothetical protein n=1 Tax=unclassified Streptomyces TaxID=2593676 RepID=UPI001660C99E|nr:MULTISPECIES: hypothetical protein [unclassified Streptomyces]MBD0709941.1 hypothetical protein [Streptomyces sp. CBMA291]MBD0718165.1 hypothetical protein [Streptomyces sp. CBMA370]
MTTAEGWTAAVRDRLAPGRLLPLGTAADGAWITERAARTVLDDAAAAVRGVVPEKLRIGPGPEGTAGRPSDGSGPEGAAEGAAIDSGPEGARGGLRIAVSFGVSFGAVAGRPLPALAEELRAALLTAAEDGLGLVVAAVDLRVTELFDTPPPAPEAAAPPPGLTSPATDDPVALLALGVPGVAGITDALGPPVRWDAAGVRVEVAVTTGAHPLEVARAVRATVTTGTPEGTGVTVVVSEFR